MRPRVGLGPMLWLRLRLRWSLEQLQCLFELFLVELPSTIGIAAENGEQLAELHAAFLQIGDFDVGPCDVPSRIGFLSLSQT